MGILFKRMIVLQVLEHVELADHQLTDGRGYVRKVVGAVSRPALTYIANKIADVISGTGRRKAVRKPRTVRGSSWKPSGMGMRKPRKTL